MSYSGFQKNKISEWGKWGYIEICYKQIQLLGIQISKLPHEIIDQSSNQVAGTDYSDIVKSYANGIDHFEALITPYLTDEYVKEYLDEKLIEKNDEKFQYYRRKFGKLIKIFYDKGFLSEKIKTGVPIEEDDSNGQAVEASEATPI